MHYFFIVLTLSIFVLVPLSVSAIPPKEALDRLQKGNQRYMNDRLEHPNRSLERRESLQAAQEPFATILGCSDSRVSPEIVFDQGIGDLFVVRIAGNVVGDIELDSIEYSAFYLHASLVLVMGHENCGAVNAVLHHQTSNIEAVAEKIEQSIKGISLTMPNAVEKAVKANVRNVVQQLKATPVLGRLIEEGKLKIVGGYYNLKSGEVELLETAS